MEKIFSDIKKDINISPTNEGAMAPLIELLITIGIIVIKEVMRIRIEKKDEIAVKTELAAYANRYPEPKAFSNKIDRVAEITIDDLKAKNLLDERDVKLCKNNDMVAYAIYDKNDFVLSYALFSYSMSSSIVNGYAYRICDKSIRHTPELAFFIKATFEYHVKYYGPGLKKILKGKYESNKLSADMFANKELSNKYAKPEVISMDDFAAITDNMEIIINKIAIGMKDMPSKYRTLLSGHIVRTNSSNTFKSAFKKYTDCAPYMYASIDFAESVYKMPNKEFMTLLGKAMKDISQCVRNQGFEFTVEPGTDTYWSTNYGFIRTRANDDYPYFTIYSYIREGKINVHIVSNRTFRLG